MNGNCCRQTSDDCHQGFLNKRYKTDASSGVLTRSTRTGNGAGWSSDTFTVAKGKPKQTTNP